MKKSLQLQSQLQESLLSLLQIMMLKQQKIIMVDITQMIQLLTVIHIQSINKVITTTLGKEIGAQTK